jgi:membrane peptidoglycan carboxypeptidase
MKRLLPVLGALVLVGAVVAVVVWQRPGATTPSAPLRDFVVQYADGSQLWSSRDGDPKSPLVRQVLTELRAQGFAEPDQLRQVGATVVTTIDPKAQAAALSAVEAAAAAQPGTLRYSLTAVDPATGGVLAYVPGNDPAVDYAGGVLKEPGSAFFPVGVVAALQNGQTLDTVLDGRSPRRFPTLAVSDNAKCGEHCTVRDALAKSSNVVMYDLIAIQVGVKKAATVAHQAGVPEAVVIDGKEKKLLVGEGGGIPNSGLSIGADSAQMRPLDLTALYATFAAGGVQRRTHFVTKVIGDKDLLYRATDSAASAFDQDSAKSKAIADQVMTVLKDNTLCQNVVCRAGEYGLPGSSDKNSHAWTVGYTDRMAITVMVGAADASKPAVDGTGAPVGGAGLPKAIWQKFVEKV